MNQYIVRYLRDEVREAALWDVVAVARYHARRHQDNRGHFSVPRQVFSYVDHLGYLAYGESSSQAAARFIRDYFPVRYGPLAELVYAMWRHGTVHQFRPYAYVESRVDGENPRQVWWLSTNHNRKLERSQNMLVFPAPGESHVVYLIVNGPQLADDLLEAIDRFIAHIETGGFDGHGLTARLAVVRKPQDVGTLKKTSSAAKAVLNSQIELAWQSRGGRLDRSLGVAEPHPANVR